MVAYAAIAVGLTWPLVVHLSSRLPLGAGDTATVPQFNLWTMQRNEGRLARLRSGSWRGVYRLSASTGSTG